jgi:septal ring factor EnvC (AmiA/AmiB activator)
VSLLSLCFIGSSNFLLKALENIIKLKIDTKKELEHSIKEMEERLENVKVEIAEERKRCIEISEKKDEQLRKDAEVAPFSFSFASSSSSLSFAALES